MPLRLSGDNESLHLVFSGQAQRPIIPELAFLNWKKGPFHAFSGELIDKRAGLSPLNTIGT